VKIAVGGDHAGFPLKGYVIEVLKELGHEVTDCGSFDPNPIDFPDITKVVCEKVRSNEVEKGILVCGTGVGASIAANKIPGIRASVCHDIYSSHQCVEHDDVNVMCIGAQIIGPAPVKELIESFLTAEFSTATEFRRRVEKLSKMEIEYAELILEVNK
jgi:ribose 5-phosphate isomerase B